MTEHVQAESLRKHLLAVEAAVRGYARMWGEDEDAWGFVALVHDFDYEKYPDRENHPFRGVEILQGARLSGVGDARDPVARRLHAASRARAGSRRRSLPATRWRASSPRPRSCGRRRACSTSRPSSVIKRMKDKAFARAVPREDLRKGAEELGLPLDEHITNVIALHARASGRVGDSGGHSDQRRLLASMTRNA